MTKRAKAKTKAKRVGRGCVYYSPDYKTNPPKSDFRSWRVQGSDSELSGHGFDELVVWLGMNQSIHLEVMDRDVMWMDIAGCVFWLRRQHGVWFLAFTETNDDTLLLVDEMATGMGFGRVRATREDAARVKRGLAELRARQLAFAREARKRKARKT